MKVKLLAILMISVLTVSAGSAYLQKIAFADDQWSDIAKRQQVAEEKASTVYTNKYQFNNLDESKRNWTNLGYATTDENTKGRDLTGKAQMSLENALSEFDKIHAQQLTAFQNTNYTGLASVTTDEEGRNRNALIAQAQNDSLTQAQGIVSQLSQIESSYTNIQSLGTTDEKSGDRQAAIEKKWGDMETQATALVNSLALIESSYANSTPGPTTDEKTIGRPLSDQQAYSLSKAIQIFEDIHAKRLAALQSNYNPLTSTTTDSKGYDRNSAIDQGTQAALDNALRVYNDYYGNTGLHQPLYSH